MSADRRRVLFVDDESRILQGIARLLRPQRDALDVLVALSGDEALKRLETESVDVIVSDMRMPHMDGADLLTEVRARHPRIVRIILSGQSDGETIIRATKAAHQFLSKPCDPIELRHVVERACALRDRLPNAQLQESIVALPGLPSTPGVLDILRAELSIGTSLDKIAHRVAGDPGMAAKILQLTCTSFFGTPRGLMSPLKAVLDLGPDVLRSLIAADAMPDAGNEGLDWDAWADHARKTASIAKAISSTIEPDVMMEAEVCGLLHDCGRLALAQILPSAYSGLSMPDGCLMMDAEQRVFGCHHADTGAFLMALWGMPESVVDAVGFHHNPAQLTGDHRCLAGVVHVAEHLALNGAIELDEVFMKDEGWTERLDGWKALAGKVTL